MTTSIYNKLKRQLSDLADVSHAVALLQWDMEIWMPPKGGNLRSQQIATLSTIAHDIFIADEVGAWLEDLQDADLDEKERRNVEIVRKDYIKRKKYPTSFIRELSEQISSTYRAWNKAREENDFKIYITELDRLVDLKQQESEIIGYEDHPYDALMDEYEPGMKTKVVAGLFDEVRNKLTPLVDAILDKTPPDDGFMFKEYNKQKQWEWSIYLLREMGYDFDAGRQDYSVHPFTITLNARDVRVTTRVQPENLHVLTWSSIHEGGHAMYEQGLNVLDYGMPAGTAVSLSIHESQSRLYENNVARNMPFWESYYPMLQQSFPGQLKDISLEKFYKAINKVKQGLIRTEADELTYHLHVMIRFEIEKALIEGELEVKDARDAWNDWYEKYLHIKVPDDNQGILQDIHWAHGSFGYFPTYSLGSFYAAQFYKQAKKEIPGLDDQVAAGELKSLLQWLRNNIHRHGRLYEAEDLCKRITGETLNFTHFFDYAREKYGEIYGV